MISAAFVAKTEVFSSFDEIAELIRGFEAGTLPYAEWTHHAHLTVACWYLVCYPYPEAVRKIREGIQKFNRAVGIVTTKDRGYHETITLFWVRMTRHYLVRSTLECSLVGLINGLLSRFGNSRLPFEYYSRDRLLSWEARSEWMEPDLKEIP